MTRSIESLLLTCYHYHCIIMYYYIMIMIIMIATYDSCWRVQGAVIIRFKSTF